MARDILKLFLSSRGTAAEKLTLEVLATGGVIPPWILGKDLSSRLSSPKDR
jgi:hypothetical protein